MLVLHHVDLHASTRCATSSGAGASTPATSRATSRGWRCSRFGEAWHNNHHAFPTSAAPRPALRGEFDPSALGHPGAREDRPRVGRRAHQPRAPEQKRRRPPELGARAAPAPLRARARRGARPTGRSRSSFWDGTRAAGHRRRRRPDLHRPLAARARRTRCARPASSASAAPTSRASSRSTTSTPRIALLDDWKPPPLDARDAGAGWPLAAARADGPDAPAAARPPPSCARAAGATSIERDARAVRHHYDVSNEFFALFLDDVDDLQLRDLLARRDDARGGAGDQARARLHASSALEAGRAGARRRLRLGQLRDPRRRATTASTSPASRSRSRRPSWRAPARRGGGRRRPRRDPRRGLPRARAASRFDAIASIGMVEHVGDDADRRLRRSACAAAAARRAAAQPRHRAPAPRRPRGRARSPSATSSPTPRRCTSRACMLRARARRLRDATTSRASTPTTPRRCATGRGASTRTSTRRSRLAGPERVRVWRLYLRAARSGFETGFTSIYQVRAAPPGVVLAPVGSESATVGV